MIKMSRTKEKVNNLEHGNKHSIVNFGKEGWITIIYCLLMFWFYVGMVNDGSNITSPAAASQIGVSNGLIMSMNSIAGLVGIIFFVIIGKINSIIGSGKMSGILCILAGIFYILMGRSASIVSYTFFMSIVVGTIMSAGYISGGNLVAQWFPKKKGIVMGYTTMGHNLASAFYVPIVSILITRFGFSFGLVPIGIGVIILGIIGIIHIKNTPQEVGINPDNVSDKVFFEEYDVSESEDDGGWTTSKLLKTKELWLAAFATGFFQICSVGVMSQLVLRNVELGFEQGRAIFIMTVLALVGTFGSWLIGVFDHKFGTKRTMIGFALWYAAALICNFTNNMVFVYISLFMIAIGIGGSANFMTSLPASIFGRHGFTKVNSVIFPIQGAITALSFIINGIVQEATQGQIRYAYLVFAGIALLNIVIVSLIDEFKYNRDYKANINK